MYSKNPVSHLKHLAVVLKAILNSGLKLRLDNCNFFRTQLEFLGHNITRDGYTIIKSYTEPIMGWPLIASKYEAQSFLGSANYYAEFIPYFETRPNPCMTYLNNLGMTKQSLISPLRKQD